MIDGDRDRALRVERDLISRLRRERRLGSIGIDRLEDGRFAVKVGRVSGAPFKLDKEIQGVPIIQEIVSRAMAL
jgi:hypothetical protein